MANNYIPITTNGNRLALRLREAVDNLQRYRDQLAQIKANADQMIDGSDYSAFESAYGIPTGKGDEVYNLVTGAVAEMNADTNLTQLLAWLAAAY